MAMLAATIAGLFGPSWTAVDSGRLVKLARRQLGLFTRAQAKACGISPYRIRSRVASGEWTLVHRSVLALAGVELTAKVRDRAAQLAIPGSVLAGPSAAGYWGIDIPVSKTCLYVHSRGVSFPSATLLFPMPPRGDVGSADGCPITSRALTVIDCLRLVPQPQAVDLLDRALQRGWLTLAELSERTSGLIGRKGAPQLRSLVRLAVSGNRSVAERRLSRLLTQAGFAGWTANVTIVDDAGLIGVGDVVFARLRLVLECDGWAYHSDTQRFQRDRTRQNRLVAAGWTVLRFTWRDLTSQPDQVISTIRVMLARLESRPR